MKNDIDPKLFPKKIIDVLKNDKRNNANIIAGIGVDDCAVMKTQEGFSVISSDFINDNAFIKKIKSNYYFDYGRLSAAFTICDILSSGVLPSFMLLNIMYDADVTTEGLNEIIKGFNRVCVDVGTFYVGGDTKSGERLCLCSVGYGNIKNISNVLLHKNVKINDDIYISGSIGDFAAAVCVKERGIKDEYINKWAEKIISDPNIPIQKMLNLFEISDFMACSDISDGLGTDMYDICKSNNVGALIDYKKITTSSEFSYVCKKLNLSPVKLVTASGGDFQFLLTANKKYYKILTDLGFVKIGKVVNGNSVKLQNNESVVDISGSGHTDMGFECFGEEILHT